MTKAVTFVGLLLSFLVVTPLSLVSAQEGLSRDEYLAKKKLEKSEFEIDFPGGTIEEYVEMLRDKPGSQLEKNIVVTERAKDFKLPNIQVTTDMDGALGCLRACSNEWQEVSLEQDYSGKVQFVRLHDLQYPVVKVLNTKQLLGVIDKADVLAAIEIGVTMLGSGRSNVELKLHDETGLLFVKGMEEETNVVEEIISELMASQGLSVGGFGPGMGGSDPSAGRSATGLGRGTDSGGAGMADGPGVSPPVKKK